MNLLKKYQIQVFGKYISSGHFEGNTNLSSMKIMKEFNGFDKNILPYLPEEKKAFILEIGFGTGIFLKYLLERGFSNFEGIEVGKEQFEFTRSNITNKVVLITDTLNFLDKKQNTYDVILMLDVLEHIPKQEVIEYLYQIKNSLKSNGKFIFRVPNGSNPFNVEILYDDFTHETVFSKKSIIQIAKIAGFSEVLVSGAVEEDISFHGKITNVIQRIIFLFLKLFIQLQRLDCHSPLNKNLIGVIKK